MTYLITGGCGFLGSNLSAAVLKKGMDLVIFDNLSRPGSEANLEWLRTLGKLTFVKGDIRGPEILDTVRKIKPAAIFHLAGQVAMTHSIEDPRSDFEINALGTLNLLEAARAHTPDATIIYSSTNKVYGDLEYLHYTEQPLRYIVETHPEGFDESTALDFRSPYGCSKGSADQYMLDYARIYDMKTIVFRHSSLFGARQYSHYDQGWVGWFVAQALLKLKNPQQPPFTVAGNGKQVRDILFSEDIVDCYFAAVKNVDTCKGHAFNIGGGYSNSMSILELLQFLEVKLSIKLNFFSIPRRQSDQKVFIADIYKAQKYLQWNPQVGKHEGVARMIDWVTEYA
jgi:CDP-paratose 2-epimerase